MTFEEIVELVGGWEGVLVLIPGPGDGSPEVAWGDAFFYYAPDGEVPKATQPFATMVTKDYPEDEQSQLDRDGMFRVNFAAGRAAFTEWTSGPTADSSRGDPSVPDQIIAHPVYGSLGWLAVVNPGSRTSAATGKLLREAYELARSRYERRHGQ